MRFSGHVTKIKIANGSKSERDAVVVTFPDDSQFILRQKGANAFQDSQLDNFVNHDITGEGEVVGQTLIATNITIVP